VVVRLRLAFGRLGGFMFRSINYAAPLMLAALGSTAGHADSPTTYDFTLTGSIYPATGRCGPCEFFKITFSDQLPFNPLLPDGNFGSFDVTLESSDITVVVNGKTLESGGSGQFGYNSKDSTNGIQHTWPLFFWDFLSPGLDFSSNGQAFNFTPNQALLPFSALTGNASAMVCAPTGATSISCAGFGTDLNPRPVPEPPVWALALPGLLALLRLWRSRGNGWSSASTAPGR